MASTAPWLCYCMGSCSGGGCVRLWAAQKGVRKYDGAERQILLYLRCAAGADFFYQYRTAQVIKTNAQTDQNEGWKYWMPAFKVAALCGNLLQTCCKINNMNKHFSVWMKCTNVYKIHSNRNKLYVPHITRWLSIWHIKLQQILISPSKN